jgi:hypothetical protein
MVSDQAIFMVFDIGIRVRYKLLQDTGVRYKLLQDRGGKVQTTNKGTSAGFLA